MKILTLADLHTGSAFAAFPPGFELSTGAIANLNQGQVYLNKVLAGVLAQLPDKLDAIILLGDMIDGENYKESGRYLTEGDPVFQARAAKKLLEPFLKLLTPSKKVFMLSGSRYHVGSAASHEEHLGDLIGAEYNGSGRCFTHLQQWIFGDTVLLDAAHHQSYVSTNLAMPIEREVRDYFENAGRGCAPRPKHLWLLRAHDHHGYRLLQDEVSTACACPPLKLQDIFAQGSKRPNRGLPRSVGAVWWEVQNKSPYVIAHPLCFPVPHAARSPFVVKGK